jgi:hypothetical protein
MMVMISSTGVMVIIRISAAIILMVMIVVVGHKNAWFDISLKVSHTRKSMRTGLARFPLDTGIEIKLNGVEGTNLIFYANEIPNSSIFGTCKYY